VSSRTTKAPSSWHTREKNLASNLRPSHSLYEKLILLPKSPDHFPVKSPLRVSLPGIKACEPGLHKLVAKDPNQHAFMISPEVQPELSYATQNVKSRLWRGRLRMRRALGHLRGTQTSEGDNGPNRSSKRLHNSAWVCIGPTNAEVERTQ